MEYSSLQSALIEHGNTLASAGIIPMSGKADGENSPFSLVEIDLCTIRVLSVYLNIRVPIALQDIHLTPHAKIICV
jgi:hypothetical protein